MRTDSEELYDRIAGVMYEIAINGTGTVGEATDQIIAIITHPSRRLAIFNLIGEVEEFWRDPDFGADLYRRATPVEPTHERVIVVRPRGEATDV